MVPTLRLLPAWFNVRKFSLILKYEVKIDAVTCSRVHSGLWSIRILMLPHCWSLQSHVANTDPPLVPVKNNFSSVYWTGKSQYLGQIRDHLIGVGEKWIYIIGAWLMWQTWPGPAWDHKWNGTVLHFYKLHGTWRERGTLQEVLLNMKNIHLQLIYYFLTFYEGYQSYN